MFKTEAKKAAKYIEYKMLEEDGGPKIWLKEILRNLGNKDGNGLGPKDEGILHFVRAAWADKYYQKKRIRSESTKGNWD